MAAVRPEGPARPPPLLQAPDDVQVSGNPVAVDGIEQEDVPVAPQPPVPIEEPGLRRGEERLARRDRMRVARRDGRVRLEVERIADVLEPPQAVGREGRRGLAAAARVVRVHGVDRQARGGHDLGRRLDPPEVLLERHAADLDLGARVAVVQEPAQLVGEARHVVRRVVVAAARVDRDRARGRRRTPDPLGQEAMERQVRDLGRRVPDRHVEGPDRDAALAMAAGLLARHHDAPGAERVEIRPFTVHEIGRAQETRGEPLPDQAALGEPSDRREPVPDDRSRRPGPRR